MLKIVCQLHTQNCFGNCCTLSYNKNISFYIRSSQISKHSQQSFLHQLIFSLFSSVFSLLQRHISLFLSVSSLLQWLLSLFTSISSLLSLFSKWVYFLLQRLLSLFTKSVSSLLQSVSSLFSSLSTLLQRLLTLF